MPRIQDHLPKLSWVVADKLLFVLYGGIAILQIRALPPTEYGLYALLVSIQTWIFVVADGLVLQGVIQFGTDRALRPFVDGTTAILYTTVVAAIVAGLNIAEPLLHQLFDEPRFADVTQLEIIFCAVTIPRTFCLRMLMRDIQSRLIFLINAAWLGSMTVATVHGMTVGWLGSFKSLAAIAIGGMAISSTVAAILTRGLLTPMRFRKDQMKPLLQFGSRQMTASLIHTSIRQLDVALAQTFFGTATVGIYQAAKTMFRFFELGLDAATSIVYPAAVSYQASGNRAALHAVTSKALSALSVGYLAATIAVWIAGDTIGFVLGSRYGAATGMVRMLSLASLAMPFGLAGVVLIATGAIAVHTRITALAAFAALAGFVASGILQRWELFPVGIIVYYAVLGVGDWWALKRRHVGDLRLSDLWRIIPDVWKFFRER